MCIRCDAAKLTQASGIFINELAEALADAVGIIEHLKARGIALDEAEAEVYEGVYAYAKGDHDGPQARPAATVDVAGKLREALAAQGIKNVVVVDSPEGVEAAIAQLVNKVSGNKPH